MRRSFAVPLLALGVCSCSVVAQEVGSAESRAAEIGRLKPLAYVENLEPLAGRTLVMKNVVCQADGKPETQGRLYLTPLPGNLLRVARIEYNEHGKYVLEHGQSVAPANKYYLKYVTQRQPFGTFTLKALEGLWRLFGLRFTLEKVTYRCTLA